MFRPLNSVEALSFPETLRPDSSRSQTQPGHRWPTPLRKWWFADSPLEEAGFEPSVTRKIADAFLRLFFPPPRHFPFRRRDRLASREGRTSLVQTGLLIVPRKSGEPGLVQQLIAQPAVEAFDKSILH